MNFFDVVLIGLALSMDACALTIANCTGYKTKLTKKQEWSMPVCFALFQGIMPLIGFFIGSIFTEQLKEISGYLSAGIFFILGAKIIYDMIRESRQKENENIRPEFTLGILLLQAVATSIDALLIGVTFVGASISVYLSVLIIAGVTFLLVMAALIFGKYLGKLLGKYATWVGAILLFVLAIKSMAEAMI